MNDRLTLQVLDTHAGGDVSRVIVGGVDPPPGASVRQQMEYLRDGADGLRRLLLNEPYGTPEMSVDLIVPATAPGAAAGYILMEAMGYPLYSGSNTLCTATVLLETGVVPRREGIQDFRIEAPAGLVQIRARVRDGVAEAVSCEGLPSYIDTYRSAIRVPSIGEVTFSVAWSGGFHALVDASELGFALAPDEEPRLAACAQRIIEAIRARPAFRHHELGDIGPLPFLHFMGPMQRIASGHYRARAAAYVHPGVICRSPTGTGTSARLALMHREGDARAGDRLETVSLRDTTFVGEITAVRDSPHGHPLIENTISGRSHILARSEIVIDCADPLVDCDGLRHIVHAQADSGR